VVSCSVPNKTIAAPPALAVGQIWRFDNLEVVIVRLSKHLAELRAFASGKVIRRGPTDLRSIRAIELLIKEGRGHLTGHADETR
jgi:hypothetical protein